MPPVCSTKPQPNPTQLIPQLFIEHNRGPHRWIWLWGNFPLKKKTETLFPKYQNERINILECVGIFLFSVTLLFSWGQTRKIEVNSYTIMLPSIEILVVPLFEQPQSNQLYSSLIYTEHSKELPTNKKKFEQNIFFL